MLEVSGIVSKWSDWLYGELAVHHFDLHAGPATYRAFLLDGPVEVDLGFTPAQEFGPLGDGGFQVVFGSAARRAIEPVDPGHLIGLSWHHLLHVRTCPKRGAAWQAEYWVSAARTRS